MSSQTPQNLRVHGYKTSFGMPRCRRLGFWTGLEANQSIFAAQIQTTGRLPGPLANSMIDRDTMEQLLYPSAEVYHIFIKLNRLWSLHIWGDTLKLLAHGPGLGTMESAVG